MWIEVSPTELLVVYQIHLIDYLITLVSVTKFCMPLGNLVVLKAIVSETNRK